MLLEIKGLVAGYGKRKVLRGVSFEIAAGEIVALIGHNGAGKSTTLKSAFGLLQPEEGKITFDGTDIAGRRPAQNVMAGISFVPQERMIFPHLSVSENLELGAYASGHSNSLDEKYTLIHELFPPLQQRKTQRAGLMSGGEQRMLALAISLMQSPRLLLLDEPSLALSPLLVQRVMESVKEINKALGVAVLLVEQNVTHALSIADRVYVMRTGEIIANDVPANLLDGGKLWDLF
ncbi:MAG: ABC transporter ATP-binding protein [Chloroflexi bacterium]|nr:ABC transporter ATP-binding protein [Chloroflexota bacterium]